MRIIKIALHALELPLHRPYKLSGGRLLFTALDSTFVRIETDDGLVGWGEGCPWGHSYLPAHGAGIRAAAEILAPALLGTDPRRIEHVNRPKVGDRAPRCWRLSRISRPSSGAGNGRNRRRPETIP